jgi:hypothetical protein
MAALDTGSPFDIHPRPGEPDPVERSVVAMPHKVCSTPADDSRPKTAAPIGHQIIRNRCKATASFVVGSGSTQPGPDAPRNTLAPNEAILTKMSTNSVIYLETSPGVFAKSATVEWVGTTTIIGPGPCTDIGFVPDMWGP